VNPVAKLRPNERRVQLSFQREDDLRLHAFMVRKAYKCRWELPTFILAALQDAFGAEMDNEEVDAVAEEAMAKVRERKAAPSAEMIVVGPTPPTNEPGFFAKEYESNLPVPSAKPAMTPDDAYEQALKQVQQLNAEPMKKKAVRGKTAAGHPPSVQ
jgi:hypothetical protein